MVHLNTTLQDELLDVAVAERVAQVPGDGLDDEHCLIVSAFEVPLVCRFSFTAMADRIIRA